jgi:para-nitrobenzyl esterase
MSMLTLARRAIITVSALCCPFISGSVCAQPANGSSPIVATETGQVRGESENGVKRFLGIRYAAAPVGDLRFKPPVPASAWNGVASAQEYGPRCMQAVLALGREFDEGTRQSEDCLFLNIWTLDSDATGLPVMVWLHGGGFAWGSGAELVYDGTNLVKRGDVVVITLNHRLNLFGFTNLSTFGPEYQDSVNVGMLDIVQALKWVEQNVTAFGGDPDNVTVFGESGGAAKVSHLLGMTEAKGLFGKAIIQSGADPRGLDADAIGVDTRDIFAAAGMKEYDPEFIKTVPAELLVERAINLFKKGDRVHVRFRRTGDMEDTDMAARLRTVVDDDTLPYHPFDPVASPIASDVSLMLGWTKDEWTRMLAAEDPGFINMTVAELERGARTMYSGYGPMILAELRKAFPDYAPGHLAAALTSAETSYETLLAAERKADQSAPVYVYSLRWETPVQGGMLRSPHALDVPLVFDNVEVSRDFVGPGADPQRMADIMADAWIAFARDGAPQTDTLPHWPEYRPYERAVMYLDLAGRVERNPLARVHQLIGCARAAEGMPYDEVFGPCR